MSGRLDLASAFVVATAIHAGALLLGPSLDGGGGAGDAGSDRISIEAMSPSLTALIRDWDRSPAISESVTFPAVATDMNRSAVPLREIPPRRNALPEMPATSDASDVAPVVTSEAPSRLAVSADQAPPSSPTVDDASVQVPSPAPLPDIEPEQPDLRTAILPPARDSAPRLVDRPEPRPAPVRAAAPAVTRHIATGVGGDGTAGATRTAPSARLSEATRQALTSEWAAAIQKRIGRHQAYPRGTRAEGRVRVAMVILPDGRLDRVAVATSSGTEALDAAALSAVRRAAPFPPAPEVLTDRWYSVGQWITFDRR